MCGDTDYTGTTQTCKALILKLLRDCPRNQVARWSDAPLQVAVDGLLVYVTFVANLYGAKNVWQLACTCLIEVAEEDENVVGGSV